MNIFNAKFSTGQVVHASGVSNATLQSWLKRDLIIGHRRDAAIEGAGSPGIHRRYSFYNVMEIVTAKALIESGLSDLPIIFEAARSFSHIGSFKSEDDIIPQRDPGLPFDNKVSRLGRTLLCVNRKTSHVAFAPYGEDPLISIQQALGYATGFTVLEMDPVFDKVVTALGFHPQEVLDLAYQTNTV